MSDANINRELIKKYEAGATCKELSEEYNRSVGGIRYRLQSLGIELRRKGRRTIRDEVIAEVKRRYEAGEKMKALGEELGVTEKAIWVWLNKVGAKIRPSGPNKPLARRQTCNT